MLQSKEKISLRQALFIFLIIIYSPGIRFLPTYASEKAEQAGWLTPIASLIPLAVLLLILKSVFNKYKDKSIMEAFYDIFGIWIGKAIVSLYLLWSIWLSAMYLRFSVERLVGSTYPNINMNLFAFAIVVLIAYILRKGITVIARMSEIILPLIILTFIFLTIFLVPNVRLDNVTPVSTKDIIPVLKGSIAEISLSMYMFLVFFMSEHINNKEKIFKSGIMASVMYVIISVLIIFTAIGTLSSSVVSRIPVPYFVAVKQISVLDTIENIESVIVGAWIYSDFILTAVIVFISLNIFKSLFKLKETKYFLNIFMVLIYFLTLGIAVNQFQLVTFSEKVVIYVNIVLGLFIPVLLFTAGKIRKKL